MSSNPKIRMCRMSMCTNEKKTNPIASSSNDTSLTQNMKYSKYVQNFSLSRPPASDLCFNPTIPIGSNLSSTTYLPFQCRNKIFSNTWAMKTQIPNCGCGGVKL